MSKRTDKVNYDLCLRGKYYTKGSLGSIEAKVPASTVDLGGSICLSCWSFKSLA